MKPKKISTKEVLNLLPQEIKSEMNLIHIYKHQRQILKRLSLLCEVTSKNKVFSDCISLLKEELSQQNLIFREEWRDAKIWMEERIRLLKTSLWAEHSTVKNKIQIVEDAIEAKFYNPLMGAIAHVWSLLKEAAFAIAAFGDDPLFEGWARIGNYSFDSIPTKSVSKEFLTFLSNGGSGEERWQLTSEICKGWISCYFSPSEEVIYITQGHVEEFHYPNCVESMLVNNSSEEDYLNDCKTDISSLFGFLQTLSQYLPFKKGILKPVILPLISPPKTLEEAQEVFEKANLVYFLSRFDSKNVQQHPLSIKKLKELIMMFFTMLVGQVNIGDVNNLSNRQRKPRNEERVRDAKVAKNWMLTQWDNPNISHSTMVARLHLALGLGELTFEGEYESTTLERWAEQADPWPKDIKIKRSKAKNLSNKVKTL